MIFQTLEDINGHDDMLQDLKARRQQKKEEVPNLRMYCNMFFGLEVKKYALIHYFEIILVVREVQLTLVKRKAVGFHIEPRLC